MKKFESNKILIYFVVALLLTVIMALALVIYLPAFTAYADDEDTVQVQKCVRFLPRDLERSAYAGSSGVAVKDSEIQSDNEEDKIVFYLPESYYITGVNLVTLQFSGVTVEYYEFTYMGLSSSTPGKHLYIDASENLLIEDVVFAADEKYYPDVTLTLIDTDATIYLDATTMLDNSFEIKFVGFGKNANEFYVSATKEGTTKYTTVDKSLFTNGNIPYQKRAQAEREAILERKASEPKSGDIVPNTSKALRIILIVGIAIPAVIIVLLLFKPTKDGRKKTVARERSRDEFDYDERRDYRRDDRYYDDRRDDRRYDDRRDDRRDDRDYRDDRHYDARDDRRY